MVPPRSHVTIVESVRAVHASSDCFSTLHQSASLARQEALATRLAAIRGSVLRPRAVVRRFLRNRDVMRMALLYRGRAHRDEASAGPQFLNVPGAAVAHPGPQAPHHLVDERGQ